MQTRGKIAKKMWQICSYTCSKYPKNKRQICSKEAATSWQICSNDAVNKLQTRSKFTTKCVVIMQQPHDKLAANGQQHRSKHAANLQ
jgi:hypothetical protein